MERNVIIAVILFVLVVIGVFQLVQLTSLENKVVGSAVKGAASVVQASSSSPAANARSSAPATATTGSRMVGGC